VSAYADRSPAATGAARLARRLLGVKSTQGHAPPAARVRAARDTDPSLASSYQALYVEYLARSATCG
jgi:hypothetical protein